MSWAALKCYTHALSLTGPTAFFAEEHAGVLNILQRLPFVPVDDILSVLRLNYSILCGWKALASVFPRRQNLT